MPSSNLIRQRFGQYLRRKIGLCGYLSLGFSTIIYAQVCAIPGKDGPATTGGTLNTYLPPLAAGSIGPASTSIALGGASGSATSIAAGDLLLIIQMQCEGINSSNTDSYGDGTAGGGRGYIEPASSCLAGNYEYVRAGAGTTASNLDFTSSPLINTYVQDATTALNRRTFQVIRVPQYSSLTLNAPITAPFWDGNTGGIVVLDVAGTLNWNGQTIDVSGRGFRGAGGIVWGNAVDTTTPPDFVDTVANNVHAVKGEGIVGTPRLVLNQATVAIVDNGATWGGYAGGDMGRGAPGNAGGGGDNRDGGRDNGGGGGGGNAGVGGYGACGWKTGGWAGGTCLTAGEFELRGIGGDAFAQASASRLVMGGGGGSGGNNNSAALTSSGGAGGGIVMVRAGAITGIGTINANGANGQTVTTNDAAGGAGAGGSILVWSNAGGVGTLTANAVGGKGGDSFVPGTTAHGGGGGGAGGYIQTTGAATTSVLGGANGVTNTGDNPGGGAAHSATPGTGGIATALISDPIGAESGSRCLPSLNVSKATSTPTISASGAATATYTISVANVGSGAAIGVDVVDNALPPGWTFASTNSVVFTPALSNLQFGGYIESAVPGVPAVASSPGAIANLAVNGSPAAAPIWSNLTIPGAGSVAISFNVNIPANEPVGIYHNPAGAKYIDPTRVTANREIAASANNSANLLGAQVGGTANTTYESGVNAGLNVSGSNYSGLAAGSSAENVTLLADVSITKSVSTAAPVLGGSAFSYTLTPRNNGRTIQDVTFGTDQTSTASAASLGPVFNNLVTDTLPTGVVLDAVPTGTNWSCTGSAGASSFGCTYAGAYPWGAGTNLPAIVVPVRITSTACGATRTNTAVIGFAQVGESTSSNNAASDTGITPNCTADIRVTKSDGKTTTVSGATNIYSIVVSNFGSASADGATVIDAAIAGLNCSSVSCGSQLGGAVCPASSTVSALQGAGIAIPTLPSGSSLTFTLICAANASGV